MAVTAPPVTQRGTIALTDDQLLPQRMNALSLANDRRLRKAAWRRHLAEMSSADSVTEAARIFRELPDDATEHMEAGEVLLAVRKMGKRKARPILARWGVSVWAPLGDLTDRQRRGIAHDLEDLARVRRGMYFRPLSETGRHVLIEVGRADEMGAVARDIARITGINPSTVGGQLFGLQSRGLVTKEPLTGKCALWLLTAEGRREIERPQLTWSRRG